RSRPPTPSLTSWLNRPGLVGHIVQRNSRHLVWPGRTIEGLECPGRAVTFSGRTGRPGRPDPAPTPRPRAGRPAPAHPRPAPVSSLTPAGGSGRPGPGRLVPGGGEPGPGRPDPEGPDSAGGPA